MMIYLFAGFIFSLLFIGLAGLTLFTKWIDCLEKFYPLAWRLLVYISVGFVISIFLMVIIHIVVVSVVNFDEIDRDAFNDINNRVIFAVGLFGFCLIPCIGVICSAYLAWREYKKSLTEEGEAGHIPWKSNDTEDRFPPERN